MTDEDMGQAGIVKKLDTSFWWQSSFFLQKYKVVGLVLAGALAAFGWQYVSPSDRFALMAQSQQRSQATIDSLRTDVTDVKKILRVLVVIQCLDRPRKELAYMQIDCRDVQQYMDQATKEMR